MSFTDYLEDKILYKNFGNVTYNSQVNVWIALSTTAGSDNGTGFTEPSDASYNRIEMDNRQTASGWSVPTVTTSGYEIHNNGAVTFDEAAGGGWGTIQYFMVYEIVGSDNNMMAYGVLNAAKTIDSGDTAEFPSGNLVIKLF